METSFRTELKIKQVTTPLVPQRPIVLLGSCFTDNIGGKLRDSMWDICVNPCGVLYNPASIASVIRMAIDDRRLTKENLSEKSGMWFSYYFSTKFSHRCPETALERMNASLDELKSYLMSSQALILTFGTAFVFRLNDASSLIVGNCHKMPASMFTRERLRTSSIVAEWEILISRLRELNPELRIIFTVSPIRHIKDGLGQNTVSKSALILATDELSRQLPNTEYFPAYEIMNDDLRDYRFYASDMIHPSETAVNYIWERFQQKFFTQQTRDVLAEAAKLRAATLHRPNNSDEESFVEFQRQTKQRVDAFLSTHPYMKL